jgi:hypothetical protein
MEEVAGSALSGDQDERRGTGMKQNALQQITGTKSDTKAHHPKCSGFGHLNVLLKILLLEIARLDHLVVMRVCRCGQ